jgi:hypothetical protein
MPDGTWSAPTRQPLPIVLIRGFGGLGVEDEKKIAYQGFNDGTVYPGKRGENYIYEGLILRFLKSSWQYQDATRTSRPAGWLPSCRRSIQTSSLETVSSSTRRWRSTCCRATPTRAARCGSSAITT